MLRVSTLLSIAFLAPVFSSAHGETCNDPFVFGVLSSSIRDYYVPGVPFTLRVAPLSGDWPTTPTLYRWNDNGSFFSSQSPLLEITVPPPGPDKVFYGVTPRGPGSGAGCPDWMASVATVQFRRFDLGTPTPTPPPPSPSPTATPCPLDCAARLLSPKVGVGAPLLDPRFIITLASGSFPYVLRDLALTHEIPLVKIGDQQWLAEGLRYDTGYEFVWHCGVQCDGGNVTAFTYMQTRTAPSDTWVVGSPGLPTKDVERAVTRVVVGTFTPAVVLPKAASILPSPISSTVSSGDLP